ncbi:MAG: cytidylate kinase-like family protein [Deltaproteobacteria bacterium]|nr:cytidylate kinase-like family protein [Deltaproteobacteria bacterium]
MAILTISREYGSGGREIGQMVAQRLGYQYVDKERFFHDLEKAGPRWGRVARDLDEVCPTLWERHDWEYRGYVAQVEALLMEYAAADRVVIIGRGGPSCCGECPTACGCGWWRPWWRPWRRAWSASWPGNSWERKRPGGSLFRWTASAPATSRPITAKIGTWKKCTT